MCKKEYRMTLFVLTIFISFFCFVGRSGWSKDYSPNVHWVFCIDTSGSMKTKGHMDLLRAITERINGEFINPRRNIIRTGDRVTIFSFDEKVRLEATSLYQTENDLLAIRDKLIGMNKRSGSLTFISEAIVQAIDFTNKYRKFFHTSALYVFTDGKSEPYSAKWPKKRIEVRKKRDKENFKKISLSGRDHGLNIWVGVLKWEAFNDAQSLIRNMGPGGHLVDLTDFNRLSLAKALNDFAETVRYTVNISHAKNIDFGTIPYNSDGPYQKSISLSLDTDTVNTPHSISGHIDFDPDNPSEIAQDHPLEIKTREDKMVLNLQIAESTELPPGKYKGKLRLIPSKLQFGAIVIEPSQFDVEFRKSGLLAFYSWRVMVVSSVGLLFLFYVVGKIKRKIPIRV